MCGIFGYIGNKQTEVANMVRSALCELEYRGYDSWGIATSTKSGIVTKKAVGKVTEVHHDEFLGMKGTMAIGHSRWATHGNVTEVNSHPHRNRAGNIAVVHNGIVENHAALRSFLVKQLGIPAHSLFVSQTDTEVIPHLIDYFMQAGKTFEDAFVEMGKMIEGRYAIVAMKHNEPYMLALRDGSPLVLGRGEEGYFLASDVPAFLDHTRTVCYPSDHEYIKLFPDRIVVSNLHDGKSVSHKWTEVLWDKASATKDGYAHYMLKEIMEQPSTIDKAIRQESATFLKVAGMMKDAEHLFFIGCGTAAKMASLGELYMARIGGKFARAFVGSEFTAYEQFLDDKSLLFAVSQSGETADVLEALRAGEKRGAEICSLLNVLGSSMYRMSKETLFLNTGPEIAVASTKAATAQIAILILLAHALGEKLTEGRVLMHDAVMLLHDWVTPTFSQEVKFIAEKLSRTTDCYIIGRGLNAPIAHEAAIKIQEVSYVHAEGFPGGELKHGPIALIQNNTPVIALVPNDETLSDMLGSAAELKCRGAYMIGIGPERQIGGLFDEWVTTPDLRCASPIASLIPIQLLAYHLAVLRGNNPDKPRNLAKSVTVK
jgi:glucosamine--fructose-6-phosphate aminotransferase (isomerizing)